MPRVLLTPAQYDYSRLRPLVFDLIRNLEGERIRQGTRVLIKPNLLIPATPAIRW